MEAILKRILVTGGAGFIGSNFVHYLYRERPDWHITVFDKLTYAGNRENLDGLDESRVNLIVADICDEAAIDAAIAECDAVVHFAAESHNDNSLHSPRPFLDTNVIGTYQILEAVRKHGKRLHHVSTDEVYGDLELDDPAKFTPDTPYNPSSPYSSTKAASDLLVRAWVRSFGVQATISNCSNNYGPYQVPENIVPLFALFALSNKNLTIYGDGKSVRDYLFVEDHCRAIDLILHQGEPGQTYCVGGGAEKNGIEIADALLAALPGSKSEKTFVKDRPGHDRRYAIDYTKLKAELGYEPSVTFEEGLKKTVDWYKNNRWWWEPIINKLYVPDFLRSDKD